SLRAMGVHTIISVDGAVPDVERAATYGLRYVHLPIGYGGFDEERRLQLVRATRDGRREGPVYVHCHHGQHRSAGAAATVVASLGWDTPDAMIERMHVAGTSPHYAGLYACAAAATVVPDEVIDGVDGDLPEVSRPTDLVRSMVEMGHTIDHLARIDAWNWTTPEDHPDLVPLAEASRLADLLRFVETPVPGSKDEASATSLARLLEASRREAATLEDLIARTRDVAALQHQLGMVANSCLACHERLRD
ncbi:MAG: hypothetical protein KDA28_15630, partial [Phycisphaerales bacterium]|nr:hypothetical protein [Phycisphaerales bacterium]